jgi:starch phosphorylase
MEFLPGRLLGDALINLGLYETARAAVKEMGHNFDDLLEMEADAGLGNGGLGRLAACYIDSMATLGIPGYGYGIRYEYGIFNQHIVEGFQTEAPDSWLRYGNPWEIERPEFIYKVQFYGHVKQTKLPGGKTSYEWTDTKDLVAMAYDTPVPGYGNNTVNNLRLWAGKSTREFDLGYFNSGHYDKAVSDKIESENISKVLYPRDDLQVGKELRLKQEYFLVSATLQDIVRRYKKGPINNFSNFHEKVAIQLNDTHPALAIPELMRILIDQEGIVWDKAWDIIRRVFAYTNHTVLPEALEKWPVSLLEYVLPRHLQIIFEINERFLNHVREVYAGDPNRARRMSIVEERIEKQINMANLAIIGSHSVNGVAALHTDILRNTIFKDFYSLWPQKFNNKTNGVTQRRWLKLCNPDLSELITSKIGDAWITDLTQLRGLEKFGVDEDFQQRWQAIKLANKKKLARYIQQTIAMEIDPNSIFDCQVKRIHEYKRQLLNVIHVVTLYHRLKMKKQRDIFPRTVLFAGKAAPSYTRAKQIIKLIHAIADTINNDPETNAYLKLIFVPNYSVSLAQLIIPAADVSEQISTAGMEASGTGNMKFALNGALTIGTLDGANVEIMEEVGRENIFIFGLTTDQVLNLRQAGYNPRSYYNGNRELRDVIDRISSGYFMESIPDYFKPFFDSLLDFGDYYMLLADYADYVRAQQDLSAAFRDRKKWTEMSILNVARIGKFSSDRSISEYASEIWNAEQVTISMPEWR